MLLLYPSGQFVSFDNIYPMIHRPSSSSFLPHFLPAKTIGIVKGADATKMETQNEAKRRNGANGADGRTVAYFHQEDDDDNE